MYIISVQISELSITLASKTIEDQSNEFHRKETDCARTTEKNHDWGERRTAYSTDKIAWLSSKRRWKNLTSIGAIKTEFEKNRTKTEKCHYYTSNHNMKAVELFRYAPMEWAVETKHWFLDVH